MGSLLIGIKRFFQNKNTITVLALLASVGVIYVAYNMRIKAKTQPVNVPYATREIGPWTLITEDMVSVRKVPGGVITKNVITSTDKIVGKYVSNKAVIPQGSMFYEDVAIAWEQLPTSPFEDIPDGNTVYRLPVDLEATYGNSIYPGNYIDIYFRTNSTEGGVSKVWIGKFAENAKVLAVIDGTGRSVFETDGAPSAPTYLMFSVTDEIRLLFEKVTNAGLGITLFPVQRNASYSNSKEEKNIKIVGMELVEEVNKRVVEDSKLNGGK